MWVFVFGFRVVAASHLFVSGVIVFWGGRVGGKEENSYELPTSHIVVLPAVGLTWWSNLAVYNFTNQHLKTFSYLKKVCLFVCFCMLVLCFLFNQ
jgi:hypothetical protein